MSMSSIIFEDGQEPSRVDESAASPEPQSFSYDAHRGLAEHEDITIPHPVSQNTNRPLNAATELLASRFRKDQGGLSQSMASDPRRMSFPDLFLPYRRLGTPVSRRSIASDRPITQARPPSHKKIYYESQFSSQVSIGITEADTSNGFNPPQRKPPSRFWGRDPPPGEPDIGEELGENSPIWDKYCEEARWHDRTMTDGWNSDMDMLLVFAALFSAILTAFLIEFYRQLKPDNGDVTVEILMNMAISMQCLANGTVCRNMTSLSLADFQDPVLFRWIVTLWFTSLMLSLSVSAVAILVKQWIHAYYLGLKGVPGTYATIRQFRYAGIEKWRMGGIISILPSIMYLAVALFFAGLLLLLSTLDSVAYFVSLGISIVSGLIYISTTFLPIIDPSCPFRTPAAQFCDRMFQVLSYYTSKISHLCFIVLLTPLNPIWNHFKSSTNHLIHTSAHRMVSLKQNSRRQFTRPLHLVFLHERERLTIQKETPILKARGLLWLSNSHEPAIQDLVIRGLAGLNCTIAAKELNTLSDGERWAAARLAETFNHPERDADYHYRLGCYAQAYIVGTLRSPELLPEGRLAQTACDALQWYPAVVPLAWQNPSSTLSLGVVTQAASELATAFTMIIEAEPESPHFHIILDLLLKATLGLYILSQEDKEAQSLIVDMILETLQIWMLKGQILDAQPRPPYVLSLCSVCQILTSITQPSDLRAVWSLDGNSKDTWLLLLRNLVSLPQDLEDEERLGEQGFRHWRLLRYALLDCSNLLSDDRDTLDMVIGLFINGKSIASDPNLFEHQFRCLNLIAPMLTHTDMIRIVSSFGRPWDTRTASELCDFLEICCRDVKHARAVVSCEVLSWVVAHLEDTRDRNALGFLSMLLQTLSKSSDQDIAFIRRHKILHIVNEVLCLHLHGVAQEIWDYHRDWRLAIILATACFRLYRSNKTYEDYILSSGIVLTLHRLSKAFATIPELADRRETHAFMQTVGRMAIRDEQRLYD